MSGFSEILWFEQGGLPLLAILQLLPLGGAAVVFAFKERTTAVVAGRRQADTATEQVGQFRHVGQK